MITPSKSIRPFLKWPGGKFRLLEHIQPHFPPGKRLLEPFAGAGALFLNTEYPEYLVNDLNPDLIRLYTELQLRGDEFIKKAKRYFLETNNSKEKYYAYRAQFNKTNDPLKRALLFLYLNRHGFNGLCRYNSAREFNVPFGSYKKIYFPEKELRHFIERAQRTLFFCEPFEIFLERAKAKDVIYCDPPYMPLSQSAAFANYTGMGFALSEQEKLAECAEKLAAQKITVVISNHDLPVTRKLYQSAKKIKSLAVKRSISCQSHNRKAVKELIAVF